MSQYSVAEARNMLTRLIREAEAGRPVTITRRGAAVVRLVPAAPQPPEDDFWTWFDGLGPPIQPDNPNMDTGAELIRKMRDEEPGY